MRGLNWPDELGSSGRIRILAVLPRGDSVLYYPPSLLPVSVAPTRGASVTTAEFLPRGALQGAGDPQFPGVNRLAEAAEAGPAGRRAPPARTRQLTR